MKYKETFDLVLNTERRHNCFKEWGLGSDQPVMSDSVYTAHDVWKGGAPINCTMHLISSFSLERA